MIEQMITLKNEADISFLYLCPFLLLQTMDVVAVQNISTFPIAVVDAEEMERRSVELSVYEPDENAQMLQGLLIEVEEAYIHCPRALNFSSLWDTETIENNRRESPI